MQPGGCRNPRLSRPLVPGARAVCWGSIEPLHPRGAGGCGSQRALGGRERSRYLARPNRAAGGPERDAGLLACLLLLFGGINPHTQVALEHQSSFPSVCFSVFFFNLGFISSYGNHEYV